MRLAKTLPLARIHEFLPPYPGDAPPQIRRPARALPHAGAAAPARRGGDSRPRRLGWARTAGWSPARAAQAASRCSPTIRTSASPRRRCGTSRTCTRRGSTSSARRCPACRASSSGATSASPGASPTPGRTCRTSTSRSSTARRHYQAPDGPRPFQVIAETIQVKGADAREARGARLAPRPGDLRRGRATRSILRRAATRSRLRGPRSPRTTSPCRRRSPRDAPRDWEEFVAALQRLPCAAAEHDLRRRRGQHRLRRRRTRAAAQARERPEGPGARAGLGRTLRLGGLPPLRRSCRARSTRRAARSSPPTTRSRRRAIAHHITSEWQPPYRARSHRGAAADDGAGTAPASFARMQVDVCRSPRASCCRTCSRHKPKRRGGARGADAARRAGTAAWRRSAPSR